MIGAFVSDMPGTRTRNEYCDGWGAQRMHATVAREFRLRCAPVSEYPLDTEPVWLCNDCGAQMCAEYWLRGTTIRDVQTWRGGNGLRIGQRTFGVWEKATA